jgi:hypothetical protein
MKIILFLFTAYTCIGCMNATAHHSFSIYEIDNRIDMAGVLTRIEFRQPHIVMELEIINDDGSIELWAIESMSPQRWDRMGISRNITKVGEVVTIEGWPARNGEKALLLSAITTERERTLVIDRIRQPGARAGF